MDTRNKTLANLPNSALASRVPTSLRKQAALAPQLTERVLELIQATHPEQWSKGWPLVGNIAARLGIGGASAVGMHKLLGEEAGWGYPALEGIIAGSVSPRYLVAAGTRGLRALGGGAGRTMDAAARGLEGAHAQEIFQNVLGQKALLNVKAMGVPVALQTMGTVNNAAKDISQSVTNTQDPNSLASIAKSTATGVQDLAAATAAGSRNAGKPVTQDNPQLNEILKNLGIGAGVLGLGGAGYLGYKAWQDHRRNESDLQWNSAKRQGMINMRLKPIAPGMPSSNVSIPAAALPRTTYRKLIHQVRNTLRTAEQSRPVHPQGAVQPPVTSS